MFRRSDDLSVTRHHILDVPCGHDGRVESTTCERPVMKLPLSLRSFREAIMNPSADPAVAELLAARRLAVPVVWLLGKTGAGKSSIVQRLTGDDSAEIGNGFAPCTRHSRVYDHPGQAPVMRFIDTRGLGEPDYDPREELAACRSTSHALLLVVRLDDPDQSAVLDALRLIGKELSEVPLLLVHTASHAVPDADERRRAMQHVQLQIDAVCGKDVPSVSIDFTDEEDGFDDPDMGLPDLREAIIGLVPELHDVLLEQATSGSELALFQQRRNEILGYASAAAAIDLVPAVGLVAVPSLQGKLLHSLAQRYDLAWTRQHSREFLTALGSTFLYRYALSMMARQLGKLIPVYGQSVGAAAASSISFASTYAIGRVACLYLHHRVQHIDIDRAALQAAFREAFDEKKHAPESVAEPDTMTTNDQARGKAPDPTTTYDRARRAPRDDDAPDSPS